LIALKIMKPYLSSYHIFAQQLFEENMFVGEKYPDLLIEIYYVNLLVSNL